MVLVIGTLFMEILDVNEFEFPAGEKSLFDLMSFAVFYWLGGLHSSLIYFVRRPCCACLESFNTILSVAKYKH